MLGRHTIKSWSSTQTSVALSSGEAEFNGVVRGSGIGLGCQSLLRDLRLDLPVRVWTDSSAAIGICTRQGLGKLRHLDTHTLWVQQAVRSGRIDLRKVLGEVNPADLFTKHSLSRERLMKLVELFSCEFRGGRAEAAPLTRTAAGSKATISDAMRGREGAAKPQGETYAVQSQPDDPIMPHNVYDADTIDRLYPSIEVPDELDADDPEDPENDPMYKAGMCTVDDLMYHLSVQGRKRKLAEIERGGSEQAWLANSAAEHDGPHLAFERAGGSGATSLAGCDLPLAEWRVNGSGAPLTSG